MNTKPTQAPFAQGWMKVPQTPTEHNFEKGYPLCGWKLPIKTDAHGRCCECERATKIVDALLYQAKPGDAA